MERKMVRNWLGTYNNPEEGTRDFLQRMYEKGNFKYVCGQLEKGENGTIHIQFFLNHNPGCRLSFVKKLCNKAHYEEVRINNGAHDYCMKQDTRVEGPFEFGTKPVQRNSKVDWQEQRDFAKAGDLDKIDPKIYITHYTNLRAIAKDH